LTRAARAGHGPGHRTPGSGKTTTLYAVLRHIDASARKVLTRGPVEYDIPARCRSTRVQTSAWISPRPAQFPAPHPDIILVGEVRDCETARIAAQAALTGHLLLASLHCAGAALAPVRLIELGLERWLVAGALELALAQRLLRTRCRGCGGSGCRACAGSGVGGRSAVFEWLAMTPHLRELLETHDLPSYTRAAEAAIPLSLAAQGRALVDEGVVDAGELAAQLELA
jgi:general secretion pathway protein E